MDSDITQSIRSVLGFEASAFTNGTEIVISYSGTDPNNAGFFSEDMQTNFALVNGNWSPQLLQAAEYYLQIKAANPGATITITGHSLGGGLAALIGVFFGVQAVTFDQAPFAHSARVLSDNASLLMTRLTAAVDGNGAPLYSDNQLAGLASYLLERTPDNPIPRSSLVSTVLVAGEVLDASLIGTIYSRIGDAAEALSYEGGPSATDLHSQSLLTAFLQSTEAPGAGEPLNEISKSLVGLLGLFFDSTLYAYNTGVSNATHTNFLDHLVRNQAGGIGGIPAGGNGMLTGFTVDLSLIAAAPESLSRKGQDGISAQAIEWYYWQGKNYSGQQFIQAAGGLLQYATATASGLTGAEDRATVYVKSWLDEASEAHGTAGIGTRYDEWNLAVTMRWRSQSRLRSEGVSR